MALDKVGFAGTVYGECYSPSVTLGEQFAECFMPFAECSGHSANSTSPVVKQSNLFRVDNFIWWSDTFTLIVRIRLQLTKSNAET